MKSLIFLSALFIFSSHLFALPWGDAPVFKGIGEHVEDLSKKYKNNVDGFKAKVCPKRQWCRMWEGIFCGVSRRFFSVCHTACQKEKDFMASKCVKQAKSNHGFDPESHTYQNNNYTPLEDIIVEIEESEMGGSVSQKICGWLQLPNFLESLVPKEERPSLARACLSSGSTDSFKASRKSPEGGG